MAVASINDLAEARQERERRARVQEALRSGERVATDDLREGENFAMLHLGVLGALASARRLTSNEYQFIFALLSHTHKGREWAVVDYQSGQTPTLADWARWMGGMTVQQVNNIRASLRAKGVLRCVDEDPARLALNPWEEWEPEIFEAHEGRAGAGRRPKQAQADTEELPSSDVKLPNLSGVNEITEFTPATSGNLAGEITEFNGEAPRPGNTARRRRSQDGKTGKTDPDTDANASGAAPAAPLAASAAEDGRYPAPAGWPERRANEPAAKFYPTAVQACEKNRAAAAAYAAHQLLNVPADRKTILRMTGIISDIKAKHGQAAARWGIVVQALLEASTAQYDTDPLDYAQKVAMRLAAQSANGAGGRDTRPAGRMDTRAAARAKYGATGVGSPDFYTQRRAQRAQQTQQKGDR